MSRTCYSKNDENHHFEIGVHLEYFSAISAYKELKYFLDVNELGYRKVDKHNFKIAYRDHRRKIINGHMLAKFTRQAHIGRKSKSNEQLLMDHPDIIEAFINKKSLRQTHQITNKAINTIRKVFDLCKAETTNLQ